MASVAARHAIFLRSSKEIINGIKHLKGQSQEKVGEMSVWGVSLGPNYIRTTTSF
jgi:hypothetical protein